jgi:hypothetical protein
VLRRHRRQPRHPRAPAGNPDPNFPPVEFVIACGDLKNAAADRANWNLWLEAFKGVKDKPCYYPVLGNWDAGDKELNKKTILPAQKGVVGDDPEKYHVDWRNVRVIVSKDVPYVEKPLKSLPEGIDHVFVADHWPVFPRFAYAGEPDESDVKFWNMLLKHRDKVRAVLVGHTHRYSRMRVADPTGKAKDGKSFPDEEGGIYQIDCGNAGRASHGDDATTIVEVMIDGKDARFRVVQASHEKPTEFRVKDEWKIVGKPAPAGGPATAPASRAAQYRTPKPAYVPVKVETCCVWSRM